MTDALESPRRAIILALTIAALTAVTVTAALLRTAEAEVPAAAEPV